MPRPIEILCSPDLHTPASVATGIHIASVQLGSLVISSNMFAKAIGHEQRTISTECHGVMSSKACYMSTVASDKKFFIHRLTNAASVERSKHGPMPREALF